MATARGSSGLAPLVCLVATGPLAGWPSLGCGSDGDDQTSLIQVTGPTVAAARNTRGRMTVGVSD
jgi:hypothetical protein